MKASRIVPGRPKNDGSSVITKITDVIAGSLDPSPNIDIQSVRNELSDFEPTLTLLALGGHLCDGQLVLVAEGLRLCVNVPVGEAAVNAEEDVTPSRGAAKATKWTLHVIAPSSLQSLVTAATKSLKHISTEVPPDEAPEAEARELAGSIDLTRLASLRGIS